MRTLFLTLALTVFGGARLFADDPVGVKPQPTLKPGVSAPPLKATKWFHGPAVTAFEPGKIYIVEFWATWCGPCVAMMPHLGDLQEELASKDVVIVGFTANDPGNTLENVTKFVNKRGDKLGYTIAYAENRETYDAYMKASGQAGIPCSYVIGRDGKIAYIGHPLFLDEVMPKLFAGTWDSAKGTAELLAADKLWDETYAVMTKKGDPSAQLEKWEKFSAKWPRLAADPYMNAARLKLLVASKRTADARQLAESILKKATKRNDTFALSNVASAVTGAAGQANLAAIGVSAAEAAMTIEGETAQTLIQLAKAYSIAGDSAKQKKFGSLAVAAAEKAVHDAKDVMGILQVAAAHDAAGDKEQAKAAAEKAVALIDPKNQGMKQYIEDRAKKFGFEPKKEEGEK